MSTSHLSGTPSGIERLAAYVLDFDGDMYGQDERERTRWYEGIALAAAVQWVVVPWVMAITVWSASAATAHVMRDIGIAFLLPMLLATLYVTRRNVDTTVHRWTAKRIIGTLLTVIPIFVFLAGYAHVTGMSTATRWGMFAGALVGGGSVIVTTVVARRRGTS